MKVALKYPRTIEGIHYGSGIHAMPDSLMDHWFFQGLIKVKDAEILEAIPERIEAPAIKDEEPSLKDEGLDLPPDNIPGKKSKKKGNR